MYTPITKLYLDVLTVCLTLKQTGQFNKVVWLRWIKMVQFSDIWTKNEKCWFFNMAWSWYSERKKCHQDQTCEVHTQFLFMCLCLFDGVCVSGSVSVSLGTLLLNVSSSLCLNRSLLNFKLHFVTCLTGSSYRCMCACIHVCVYVCVCVYVSICLCACTFYSVYM